MSLYHIITEHSIDKSEELIEKYADMNIPYIWRYGCKVYSQNGEDGILYKIFQSIRTTNKITVELCAGDGIECNSANLIINHGFTGYLFDGSMENIKSGIKYYQDKAIKDSTIYSRVNFAHSWITAENIVGLLKQCNLPNNIDLLITDIDGNDYWVLKSIIDSGIRPRVICVEYQDILGPNRSVTIPYNPNFNHQHYDCWQGPNYCGASLRAFINLLKDYAFVGCEALGFNGFFVLRTELNSLKEMTDITPCFEIPKVIFGMKERQPRTASLQWIEV